MLGAKGDGSAPAPLPASVAREVRVSTLLVVNGAPYGSEAPYNAFRLADALALREEPVEVFLMGDGVHSARAGQDPHGAHASLESLLSGLLERGVAVACCGTCCRARGLGDEDLIDGVTTATIHDLAEAVARCDAHLSF
jgi:sulfur relay (sulfurtransferase) complex TusBCD TusD component (DsrE family)